MLECAFVLLMKTLLLMLRLSPLLAQVPEESLAGLCDHQTVEEAAS